MKVKATIKNLKFLVLSFGFAFCILNSGLTCFAQDNEQLVNLSKRIMDAKDTLELNTAFSALKDLYFKDHRYSDMVVFLKSLSEKKDALAPFANYYIALSRYSQLKRLEEAQQWDEYFNMGNTYREELTSAAQKAIDATKPTDPLNVLARLVLWKFHADQQDTSSETALSDLMGAVSIYTKEASYTEPIKEVADELLSYGEKGKSRELYKLYSKKIISSDISTGDLLLTAKGFYKDKNLELAEGFFDAYIERIFKEAKKEQLVPVLVDISRQFAYKDEGLNDPAYAEKIFALIENAQPDILKSDQDLLYLRAFNLEKAKEYAKAKQVYLELANGFPNATRSQQALFKAGIIDTYFNRDIKSGRSFFESLAAKEKGAVPDPYPVSASYQLGLLSQWEGDVENANKYYDKVLEKAGEEFTELSGLAKERKKEISDSKPLEYNLKTFMDVALKEENRQINTEKLQLSAHPYKLSNVEETTFTSVPYFAESGCMQVELEYLWSGEFGKVKPNSNQGTFSTSYSSSGTKVVNLVVVSVSGIIGYNFDMLDVY